MNKTEILEYVRYKLDVINTNISPAYEDEELEPFLDKAQLLIIKNAIKDGNLDLIQKVLITKSFLATERTPMKDVDGMEPNNEEQMPFYISLADDLVDYISSSVKVTRPSDTVNKITTATWIKNEKIKQNAVRHYLTNHFNKPYFREPKAYSFNNNKNLVILPDYWTVFADTDNTFQLTYAKIPTSFSVLGDLDSPDLDIHTHYDIADKAAGLIQVPINAQKAATDMQVDDALEQSDKQQVTQQQNRQR